MSEERFWATFVQCLFCQAVIFWETFGANHTCGVKEPKRSRYTPYTSPTKVESTTRSRVAVSRLQRTYALAIIPGSPPHHGHSAAGSIAGGLGEGEQPNETSEGDVSGTGAQESHSADGADTEPEDAGISSDFDMPALQELLGF